MSDLLRKQKTALVTLTFTNQHSDNVTAIPRANVANMDHC